MRTVLIVLANTIRVTFRRRSSLVVYFLLPIGGVILAVAIMSVAATRPIRIGVINEDGGPYAADLAASLATWGNYRTTAVDRARLDSEITAGKIDCGLIIPPGYSTGVPEGHIEKVTLVSLKGQAVTAALSGLIDQYSAGLVELARASGGDAARFAVLYSEARRKAAGLVEVGLPDQGHTKGATLVSIGYFVMFVMLGAGITSQLILAEKRSRTYYRICSAPVQPRHYLAGNGAAGLLIIAGQIIVVLAVMRLFGITTHVPPFLLGAILLLFGVVAVALGMLVAAYSSSTGVAVGLSTLVVTPSCMLSGCFWSISFMPPFMQKLALFMPQRWVLDSVTRLQQGGGAGSVALNLLVLAAFAATFFLVAVYGFSRREESGQFI